MTVVNALSKQPDRPRSWVSIIFGLWCGTLYSVVIGSKLLLPGEGESTSQIAALVAAIVWPLGYFLFSRNRSVAARIRGDFLAALYVFSLFCLLSCFNSPIALKSIAYTGLTLVGVWIAVQFIFRMEARQFETGLKIYALINIPVLVSFAAYDYVPGVRLGLGKDILNPNAIAMVSFSAALSTMAFRNWLIRYALMAPVFVILYLTGSRASTVATLIGLSIIAYERTRLSTWKTKVFMFLTLSVALSAILFNWETVWSSVKDFLQLESRDRGFESGASGRTVVWNATWELFWDNPVLGIGFRAHEVLLGISSHNGYLAMLAEIGLIGFVAVIYIILIGVFLLWRKVRHTELTFSHSILFGLSCGYLFLAMFERFLINVGNPTSLLFLIATLMSAKVTSRQRISLVRHANVSIRQPGLKGLKYTSM